MGSLSLLQRIFPIQESKRGLLPYRQILYQLSYQESPHSSVGKESTSNAGDPRLVPGSGRSPGEKRYVTHSKFLGFPGGSAGKESACNVGDMGSIPGLGRSPGEGKGYPVQCCGLENSMDCVVHGVTKSWTQLSDFHYFIRKLIVFPLCTFFLLYFYILILKVYR